MVVCYERDFILKEAAQSWNGFVFIAYCIIPWKWYRFPLIIIFIPIVNDHEFVKPTILLTLLVFFNITW